MDESDGSRREGGTTDHRTPPEGTVRCPECGASVPESDEACPSCGARRGAEREGGILDQYSRATWLLSLLVAFLTYRVTLAIARLTYPFGLVLLLLAPVVPLYFLVTAAGDDPVERSRTEVAAVLVLNLVGIAVVEWQGERGARFALGFVGAMSAMGIILLFVFLLGAVA